MSPYMKIYLVGGAVRDKLLGLPVQDRDYVVVGSTPEEMTAKGFKPVGADFPVFLHPVTKEEYALARTERKSGHGYKGFTIYAAPDVTLEEDLRRRDLTINAMAEDEQGNLIDPFHGAEDLRNGVLRHVSEAFAEDPVRVLRVARFAARFAVRGFADGTEAVPGHPWPSRHSRILRILRISDGAARQGRRGSGSAERGFHVAPETNQLMQNMVASGEIDHLVAERVWAELERALGEDRPSHFFEVLRGCGALRRLFPEIEALYGVPQPEKHHPEVDTGVHVMMVLDQAARLSADGRVRFAALMHDLGKGTTLKEEWPQHIGHEERGVDLVKNLCQRFRVPNDYRDLAVITARFHAHCHRIAELRPATVVDTLESMDAFRRPERVDLFVSACEADFRGRTGLEDRPYPQAALFRNCFAAARLVDTAAVAAAGNPGPEIGARIREARIAAVRQVLSLANPS
jgi:tRNA nucleotidyltransferase (CCA-adding enzyme)